MLLCAFGVSTSLLHTTMSLLKGALDAANGPTTLVVGNRLEDLRARWGAIDAAARGDLIFTSDSPDDATVELFRRVGAPVIVVAEDFEDSVRYIQATRRLGLAETLRFLTQTYATLQPVLTSRSSYVVRSHHFDMPARRFLKRVFGFIGVGDEVLDSAFTALGLKDGDTVRDYAASHFPMPAESPLPSDQAHTLRRLAPPYQSLVAGAPLRESVWPTELFLDWDRPGQFLHGPIDLTGPARFIICGPYLHLPIGAWRATFVLRLAGNFSGNRLSLDLFCGEIIGGIVADLPKEGDFALDVDFEIIKAYLPLEARIQILEGAIEGSFELLSVKFTSLAEAEREPWPSAAS